MDAPPAWVGLLASVQAGLSEEVLLRLGVLTLLVWVAARLTRTVHPGPRIFWIANVVAAALFGVAHLPSVAIFVGLTPAVVAWVVLGNAYGGLIYGWMYWRDGLLAAMLTHAAVNAAAFVVLFLANSEELVWRGSMLPRLRPD